jgi:hypothetical protein
MLWSHEGVKRFAAAVHDMLDKWRMRSSPFRALGMFQLEKEQCFAKNSLIVSSSN